ncbi:YceI family protein [Albimonas pacifica]|uniref:Polyisoprenoid-binding protein YceI n=1 Tax=Albimonas pacifica TaxID=1114924 RepID=A0A1I3IR53_9RHOB|nr:YceI family protein [Albimonas pacifica]SFI50330.1 Polyisoprenoid-binding protein YceI [Albimonas pacifica]
MRLPLAFAPAFGLAAGLLAALPAAAEPYAMDRSHAAVIFSVDHVGFSVIHGRFNDFSADIDYDPENLAGSSVSFTLQAGSIDTGWDARDQHIKSGDMLDVENHPEITFVSKSVEVISDTQAKVTGEVTIKGVTNEETFDVTLNKTGPSPLDPDVTVVGFTIEGELDRTAYGVDYFAPAVAATMPVRIDLEASPAK